MTQNNVFSLTMPLEENIVLKSEKKIRQVIFVALEIWDI